MTRTCLTSIAGLLLVGCGTTRSSSDQAAPFAAKLDSVMADAVAKRELPGAALVVVQGDRITYAQGFGQADLATGRPMTDSTPIVIGSTSKPLTALAVLRLVQLGKLALDTPIARYLPDLAFKDPRGSSITLRHLLTNRAGLPIGFSGRAYQRPMIVDDGALERLSRQMTELPLLFSPDSGYAYSNRGWALAGYVVQRVSGVPIERFLRSEVFEPLGMTSTTLEFWTVPDLVTGYAEGRRVRNHPHPASLSREYGPSGMVVSTARDMGRLLVAMLNEGKTVSGSQFLTPALIREAVRGQAEATSELGGPTRYGLGWEVDSAFGALTIKKAGSVHSMVSLWIMLPERKLGLAFAFNREDYQVLPIVPSVLKVVAGGEPDPFPVVPVPPYQAPAGIAVPVGVLDRWTGSFDTRFGEVSVYRRGDSLLCDFDGSEVALVPTSDSTFAVVDDLVNNAGATLRFRRQGGTVTLWRGADSLGVMIRR